MTGGKIFSYDPAAISLGQKNRASAKTPFVLQKYPKTATLLIGFAPLSFFTVILPPMSKYVNKIVKIGKNMKFYTN